MKVKELLKVADQKADRFIIKDFYENVVCYSEERSEIVQDFGEVELDNFYISLSEFGVAFIIRLAKE